MLVPKHMGVHGGLFMMRVLHETLDIPDHLLEFIAVLDLLQN